MGEKETRWEWGELKTNSITVFVGGNSCEVIILPTLKLRITDVGWLGSLATNISHPNYHIRKNFQMAWLNVQNNCQSCVLPGV